MPAGKEGGAGEERRASNAAKRETFRPPWVKEGPDGSPPKPSNLWSKNRQSSKDGAAVAEGASGKKPSQSPQENGNGASKEQHTFVKPQLKPVPPKEAAKSQPREGKLPIKLNSVKDAPERPELKKPPLNRTSAVAQDEKNIDKAIPTERNAIIRQESLKKISVAPKAPPMPPPAPAFPRPADGKQLSIKKIAQIEQLKSRPKVRPDWTALLKEVESERKLKHVECNDRSKPLLPAAKDNNKAQFIYESEKSVLDTSHNQLIKEIQQGVALKKVKTNDRSKPLLEGLRKFRRQMTIEEQIIKSQSMASIPPAEIADEADELDDIDKVRDDLQSTKQMMAIELRNKEALARDNKRLQTRIQQLEAELDKEKSNKKAAVVATPTDADEKLLTSLKSEAADARRVAEDLEKKFHDAANQLDNTKSELEEVRKQKQMLEKKLLESVQGGGKRFSMSDKKDSFANDTESEEEPIQSDSGGSDNEEKKERRAVRDVKQLRNKLRSYKNKEDNAKKERMALKTQVKSLQQAIKEEKKKYKALQREVTKMEALMKEDGDDSQDEEEEEEKAEESESEETESETESSESDSDSDKSVSEPEDAQNDQKKDNLNKRNSKHESRLSALKKGNYLLKANVERLQDDLNKQKEESISLQQDLDSVLAELG